MTLQTNSPRVRYPVRWGRVMGEKPTTHVRGADNPQDAGVAVKTCDILGPRDPRRAIIPPQPRPGWPRDLWFRAHAHKAECGHSVACDATRKERCPSWVARKRPATCALCGKRK